MATVLLNLDLRNDKAELNIYSNRGSLIRREVIGKVPDRIIFKNSSEVIASFWFNRKGLTLILKRERENINIKVRVNEIRTVFIE